MIYSVRIDPRAVYDDSSLRQELGLSPSSLGKARRDGSLKFARKGNRTLYIGQWVLDWIMADDVAGTAPAECHA